MDGILPISAASALPPQKYSSSISLLKMVRSLSLGSCWDLDYVASLRYLIAGFDLTALQVTRIVCVAHVAQLLKDYYSVVSKGPQLVSYYAGQGVTL